MNIPTSSVSSDESVRPHLGVLVTNRKTRAKGGHTRIFAMAALAVLVSACSGGDSGGGEAAPGGVPPPTVSVIAPAENAAVPTGPVAVSFAIQSFTIGTPGQDHLHFYLDQDDTPYMFYNGPGINEDNGVLYDDAHTHFAHWKTGSSFDIFGLSSDTHTIRFALSDQNHNELANPEARTTLTFSVSQPPAGELTLEPVLTGLNFPVGLTLAPDGRVFFNERLTGAIRIIDPQWQLRDLPFCVLRVETGIEQGLLGLTLDPEFSTNNFVYAYYTAASPLRNRVVRYTDSNGTCSNETVILDDIPANTAHNGGILQFGPDGKLYVMTGDAVAQTNSQSITSLAGKILRLNSDGSVPTDNVFVSNTNANAKKVHSLGHRNSYGFTFHDHTGHLWQTENGPEDSDEVNRIVAGGNYGWPTVRGIAGDPNFRDPILSYTPSIAPTGIISIPENTTAYPPEYRNNLLFAAWNDGRIYRVILSGPDLTLLGSANTAYNGGEGGLLSLMLGADGFIYVSNSSAIFRIVAQ